MRFRGRGVQNREGGHRLVRGVRIKVHGGTRTYKTGEILSILCKIMSKMAKFFSLAPSALAYFFFHVVGRRAQKHGFARALFLGF